MQFELTRYLPEGWVPVIESDVDGSKALPLRLDAAVTSLGKLAASRRVARTIYLGSAPTPGAAHRGIEDRRIKLGCVLPGESTAVFGDALRRLAAKATYLYQDGAQYWYDTQPTVTKTAADRAEQLRRDPDKVAQAIKDRLRTALRNTGGFNRIHAWPESGYDVPDDRETRLVVLSNGHPYHKGGGSLAETVAGAILESRGTTPRIYRNTLVFLAPDQTRLQDLDEAVRRHMAWESILNDTVALNLSPNQVKQSRAQLEAAADTVTARLPETYQWLLAPTQSSPTEAVTWDAARLTGQGELAVRAARRLKSEELLVGHFAGTRLRMELDNVPLWRGDHVEVRQVVEDFARYVYLPRLQCPADVLRAVTDGVGLLTWASESFAYADSFDEAAGRYRGLRRGEDISLTDADGAGLLVKPDVAQQQLDPRPPPPPRPQPPEDGGPYSPDPPPSPPPTPMPKRYHGAVGLDPTCVGLDASRIADEVIVHLTSLGRANVTVTLEIAADLPDGAPENVVRTVTENSVTLRFSSHGFERE